MTLPLLRPGGLATFQFSLLSPRWGLLPEPWRDAIPEGWDTWAEHHLGDWGYPAVRIMLTRGGPMLLQHREIYFAQVMVGKKGRDTPGEMVIEALEAEAGQGIIPADFYLSPLPGMERHAAKEAHHLASRLGGEVWRLIPWWAWVGTAALTLVMTRRR